MSKKPRKDKGFAAFTDLHRVAHRVMEEYGFEPKFPKFVNKEVRGLRDDIGLGLSEESVRDMRDADWCSIDNDDTEDYDQLQICERRANREIRVLIAIADVDYHVPKGSHTDRHASHNATSVYTGIETFPMLPQILCTDLSSLQEGSERLAVVIEYFVKKDGSVRYGEIFRAAVQNKAALVYETVGDWLLGHGPIPEKVEAMPGLKEQILLQNEAAERLQKFRAENGALDLETIEASAVVENDKIVDLVVKKKLPSRTIIENFMIAANGTMVDFLEKHNFPYIQRVVRRPKRWSRIVEVALEMGCTLPRDPDPKALLDFLLQEKERDPDTFPDLSLTIVKLLGRGEYVASEAGKDKIGHFGLAVVDYTHSTAPNRRYIDLIIQRLVKAALNKQACPYTKPELYRIAEWCTVRDQDAKKVERFMRKVEGCVLLQGRVGDVFDGIVTGCSDDGVYVRIIDPPVEGKVVKGEHGMDVGEKVKVRLVNLVPERGFIDFARM